MEVKPNTLQKESDLMETMEVRYEIVGGPTRAELAHGFFNLKAEARVAYFKVMKMAWTGPRTTVDNGHWFMLGQKWEELLSEPVVLPILLEDWQSVTDTVYLVGCLLGDAPANDLKVAALPQTYRHLAEKGMCWQDGTKLRVEYHDRTVTGTIEPFKSETVEIVDGRATVMCLRDNPKRILETCVTADEGICGMTELRLQQICERLEQNIFAPCPMIMRLTEIFQSTENRRDLCNKLRGLCEQIEKRHADDYGYMEDARNMRAILQYYQPQRVLRRKHELEDLIEDELFVSLCGEVANALIANWVQF